MERDVLRYPGRLNPVFEIERKDGLRQPLEHLPLAALAAQKGGSADGKTIQANMAAVSGSTKGEKCDSYKACVALLKDGKEIQYQGQTSIGAFNDAHDPSSASIGVYKYDADNKPVFDHSQEGSVPKA